MKTLTKILASAAISLIAWCGQAVAQDAAKAPSLLPVELYTCNYQSLAKDHERFMNSGGWREARKTMGGVSDCGMPRMYHADLVRNGFPLQLADNKKTRTMRATNSCNDRETFQR